MYRMVMIGAAWPEQFVEPDDRHASLRSVHAEGVPESWIVQVAFGMPEGFVPRRAGSRLETARWNMGRATR